MLKINPYNQVRGLHARFSGTTVEPLQVEIPKHQKALPEVQAFATAISQKWKSLPTSFKQVLGRSGLQSVQVAKTMDDLRAGLPSFREFPRTYSEGPCKFYTPHDKQPFILMPMTVLYTESDKQKRPYSISPEEGAMTFCEEASHIFDDVVKSPDNVMRHDGQGKILDSISGRQDFLNEWYADINEAQSKAPEFDLFMLDRAISEPREGFAKRMACILNEPNMEPWTPGIDTEKALNRLRDEPGKAFVPDMHLSKEHFRLINHWLPRTEAYIRELLSQSR